MTPGRRCRVCEAAEAEPFFRLSEVPVQDGLLYPSPAAALTAPTGDIELVFCGICGYVGNRAFDAARLRYDPAYDISLHYSPVYQAFTEELVDRLARTYALSGKIVLEIGSGKGDFLRALCERADCKGVGFDPTSTMEDESGGNVRVVRDFYSEKHADEPADLVCCRHVLNSLPDLRGFLGTLRRTLGARTATVVYTEVPDGALIFRRRVVWNVVYEHCSYFTAPSLERLFEVTGFSVLRSEPCFRDEYLGVDARPRADAASPAGSDARVQALASDIQAFGALYRQKTARWGEWLGEHRRLGRRVVPWGAGARAVAFLSALRPRLEVPYLVDINPHRQGLFLPRTAQPVAAPDALTRDPADAILITNPTFADEIRRQASDLGFRGEIAVLD